MNEPSKPLEKALAAIVAAAFGFLLAAGAHFLLVGAFEGLVYLALFAGLPAALLALTTRGVRIFCALLGLLGLVASTAADFRGADNPLIVLPWIALCFAGAALIAEVSVQALRRRQRPGQVRA